MKFVTVTALTKYIKKKFEVDPHLQDIWIKGEISNFTQHARGHMYFTLKDSQARIQVVMFAGNNRTLAFKPENGMKVLARGEISIYEQNGSYQVYIQEMQPDGIGNLYLAYEQLKKKLEQEGLFSAPKKLLPQYPKTIGVITSQTGAAIRDIVTTIRRRYPIVKLVLIPTLVQGEKAPTSIVKSIKKANELDIDVLIVGRGGGSIEELWAFNEEIVARAIFSSQIPIISAVGHETDTTIADFVADKRAATPTGAAELAVPNLSELMERLAQRKIRMMQAIKKQILTEKQHLERLQKSYALRHPKKLYEQKEQQLDYVLERLNREVYRTIERNQQKIQKLDVLLTKHHPAQKITQAKERNETIKKRLQKEIETIINKKTWQFTSTLSTLQALSPLKMMERGYGITYDKEKNLIKSIHNVNKEDEINIRLADGYIHCRVEGTKEESL